eukprot:4160920-Ditylum_brightwellii.AAC.1
MLCREVFQVDAHARAMDHGKVEGKKQKEEEYMWVRSEVESVFISDQCCGVERSTKCFNQWLTVVPDAENNLVLGKGKFCNMVLLQYNIIPKDLPKVCNGCGKRHTLQHALQCKTGGLITACYNKARDDLGLTASQAYTPTAIHNDPKVFTCQEFSVEGECPESAGPQAPQDAPVQ